MATTSTPTLCPSSDSERYFAPPLNEKEIVGNLAWHCLLVLDPGFQEYGNYPKTPPVVTVPRTEGQLSAKEQAHLSAMLSALRAINPTAARRRLLPIRTAADHLDFGRLFRGLIAELQKRDDVRSAAIRSSIRATLEESLAQWPFAFCLYSNEIAPVEPDKTKLLHNLSRAIGHATKSDEIYMIERAYGYVAALMRHGLPRALVLPAVNRPESTATPKAAVPLQNQKPVPEPTRVVHFTRRQEEVLETCVTMGELFFEHRKRPPGILEPRLFPLLCGPSGAGKTMLVTAVAQRLKASYLRQQRGDLAPQGSARMRATVFNIMDALVLNDRVVLHLDELDKFTTETGAPTPATEWGAGIFSDLWSLLDGVLPFDTYLKLEDRARPPGVTIDLETLRRKTRCNLFVVGSGTWQAAFTAAAQSPLGFCAGNGTRRPEVRPSDIIQSRQVSFELLSRFSADLFILPYPDDDEIQSLLDATGISRLAESCAYRITPEDLDFGRGGYRVLETLLTRLLVMQHKEVAARGMAAQAKHATGATTISSART